MCLEDRNTKIFHVRASQRFRRNHINGFRDQMGMMCTGGDNISALLLNYYQQLFSSSNPTEIDAAIQFVPTQVAKEMNTMFLDDFSKQEIDLALKQMAHLKAPSPIMVCLLSFFNIIGKILVVTYLE